MRSSTASIAFSEKCSALGIREDQFALGGIAHLVQDGKSGIRQRHDVVLVHLHAFAGDLPSGGRPINLGPAGLYHFVRYGTP
jgi:hypothetical protein